MTWFSQLTGFAEEHPDQVRASLVVEGGQMRSLVNGRKFLCGELEVPSLGELRGRAAQIHLAPGRLGFSEIVGDVQSLHRDPQNTGAMFQVASQFNLLEMVRPSVTPELGVGIYEDDPTQGPACAVAAGAGTIYRNYFANVNGRTGQSADNQIDCLSDVGKLLGNTAGRLWTMRNGYALPTREGLREIAGLLTSCSEAERDAIREKLRIGLQWNTEVTLADSGHTVSQAYCSALPVAYTTHSADLWEPFARLILEAAYEATFLAAMINVGSGGAPRLFLTMLGGGAFGNPQDWILDALRRALALLAEVPLEVVMVSYGGPNPALQKLIRSRC